MGYTIMKVNPGKFYVSSRFHRHEIVKFIATWANMAPKNQSLTPEYIKVTHRIKSLVIKNYRISTTLKPLCKEWESNPWDFATWLLQYPNYRMSLEKGATEYSPSTIRMHYV